MDWISIRKCSRGGYVIECREGDKVLGAGAVSRWSEVAEFIEREFAPAPIVTPGDDVPIEKLGGLGVRAQNVLRNQSFKTAGDVRSFGVDNLLKIPHCGRKAYNEIRESLGEKT